jgi:hypothetical protein
MSLAAAAKLHSVQSACMHTHVQPWLPANLRSTLLQWSLSLAPQTGEVTYVTSKMCGS